MQLIQSVQIRRCRNITLPKVIWRWLVILVVPAKGKSDRIRILVALMHCWGEPRHSPYWSRQSVEYLSVLFLWHQHVLSAQISRSLNQFWSDKHDSNSWGTHSNFVFSRQRCWRLWMRMDGLAWWHTEILKLKCQKKKIVELTPVSVSTVVTTKRWNFSCKVNKYQHQLSKPSWIYVMNLFQFYRLLQSCCR